MPISRCGTAQKRVGITGMKGAPAVAGAAFVLTLTGVAVSADAQIVASLPSDEERAFEERPLEIAEAVALTLSRHPDIARASAALSRGKADLGAARSLWTPRIGYQANFGPNMLSGKNGTGLNDNMAGPSVYLQQQVWDFGRTRGEIGYARSTTEQRRFELEAVADDLAERSALAFLEVKRFERLAQESQKHVRSLEHLRGLIALRVRAGISEKSDLLLADVRVENARGDAIRAWSSLTVAKAALANLIGGTASGYADPDSLIASFEVRDADPDFDSLPMIAAARQSEQAASARIAQVRAERYPQLGLQLGYTRNNYSYNARDNALSAMVTVSGDLYRRGNHYMVRAAEEDRRAAQAIKESAILDIRGRATLAREEIRAGYARIDAYRAQEQQANTASRIFLEEYKLGKRSLTDLLNTELEIYRAASARIVAEQDIMGARVQYQSVSGTLRKSLGLPARLNEEGAHG